MSNAKTRNFIDGHWNEFVDWCQQNNIETNKYENFEIWWECWNAAIDAIRA